jgi:hypothetical protein
MEQQEVMQRILGSLVWSTARRRRHPQRSLVQRIRATVPRGTSPRETIHHGLRRQEMVLGIPAHQFWQRRDPRRIQAQIPATMLSENQPRQTCCCLFVLIFHVTVVSSFQRRFAWNFDRCVQEHDVSPARHELQV